MSGFRNTFSNSLQEIMHIETRWLNKLLGPFLNGFILLNFLDLTTTILALNSNTAFRELSPILASLVQYGFQGCLLATLYKFLPTIPLLYATYVQDRFTKYPLQLRLLKISALVALVTLNMIFFYIVVLNNIPLLMK